MLPGTAFYETVETAVAHGIISGYGCGGPGEPCDPANRRYFRQNNPATRSQGAKIIDLALYSVDNTPTPVLTATQTVTPIVTSTAVAPTATTTQEPPTATVTGTPATATSTAVPPTATNTNVPGTATSTPAR